MMNKLLAVASIASMTALGSVDASAEVAFPYRAHIEQNIDHHQVGYVDVYLTQSGAGTVDVKFSNGKQWAGNTFAAETTFVGKDGRRLAVVRQTKGLDGSFGGRAREGNVHNDIQLSADEVAQFDHVETRMRALGDGITLEDVKRVLGTVNDAAKVIIGGDVLGKVTRPRAPTNTMFERMLPM